MEAHDARINGPDEARNKKRVTLSELSSRKAMEAERRALFFQGLMDALTFSSVMKGYQSFAKTEIKELVPVTPSGAILRRDVIHYSELSTTPAAQALGDLLLRPHVVALLDAHDSIAADRLPQPFLPFKSNKAVHERPSNSSQVGHINEVFMPEENGHLVDTIRMVGIRRVPKDQPLGLTVKEDESGYVVIARILAGGPIEKQGLLKVGDAILEVNGAEILSLEDLNKEISKCGETVNLKVLPAPKDVNATNQCYLRAYFSYDPKDDKLLPCCPSQSPEVIGLKFEKGDILQVVDQSDLSWWQAQVVGSEDRKVGLIPSQELEERRKAFVPHEYDFVHKIGICGARISKRKKKLMFSSKASSSYDKAELIMYEEVARMPPFMRKTLVLVGCHGVGRRTIKNRIVNSDPSKFGIVLPHTSRPIREMEEDGKAYHFTSRDAMEADIRNGRYLEYGELNGHLYGTKIDSVLAVIRSGKMCVLDCAADSLKFLHNSSELLPYIIFLAAPGMDQIKHMYAEKKGFYGSSAKSMTFDRQSSSRYSSRRARTLESLASLYEEDDFKRTIDESARLERNYDKYFDITIINNDLNDTFDLIMDALNRLATEPQWVPVTWVY
ncbi:protein PALS2 isoform X2 [Hyalella azteca]|uniref:Protein PALS2 isoform X2 n=1 Tax=Hyalella azteca TaxID=294128 RepID=A0A8B7NZ69_HYAAZ|nr:protein PALS2 isoform X2 [Hyalella azteca]